MTSSKIIELGVTFQGELNKVSPLKSSQSEVSTPSEAASCCEDLRVLHPLDGELYDLCDVCHKPVLSQK